ncbi:hypothetical protein ACFL2H_07215 [Planctomycetota bacterium]
MTDDQVYGIARHREAVSLVADDAQIRAFVPGDGTLDQLWHDTQFDDSDWLHGTGAVGYEKPRAAFVIREGFDSEQSEWTTDIPGGSSIVGGDVGTATASYFIPANDDLQELWADPGFDDLAWPQGEIGIGFDDRGRFDSLLRTTVDPREIEGATNVMMRIAFDVADLSVLQDRQFFLRMKYDDGFVVYINGTEMARSHLPLGEIGWDTQADNRDNRQAVAFEDFDVSRFQSELRQGRNVLAIRLVNATARLSDLLLFPELVARQTSQVSNPAASVYYTVDGTDPRQADGNPSDTAIFARRDKRIELTSDAQLIVRNFDDSERSGSSLDSTWSAPGRYEFEVRLAGDANRDGVFDTADLLHVFQIGEYDDQLVGNSTWEEGDWNGDGEFTSKDLVLAFQLGQFESTGEYPRLVS